MTDIEFRWRVQVVSNSTMVQNGMPVPEYVRTLQYRKCIGSQVGVDPWTEWKNVREFYDIGQPDRDTGSQ